MYNGKRADRGTIVVPSIAEQINIDQGSLIPLCKSNNEKRAELAKRKSQTKPKTSKATAATVSTLLLLSLFSYSIFNFDNLGGPQVASVVAAPAVVINSDLYQSSYELKYGADPLLSEPNFFLQTKNSFVSNKISFIEANLSEMTIKYHEAGEVVYETKILSKGKEGSWWETPAGLYDISLKKENHFSSFGQVYQPWSMVFQGNFFIHGWPEYPDGSPVPAGYSGGCIRLSTEDAKELYSHVEVGVPVLVFEKDFSGDSFLYEPKAPEVTTDHYLVSDLYNNTVLAGDNIDEVRPIASLTKLMTALVAAEYINLDKTVRIAPERYVDSLIPRLEGRYRVSMYSLLQLLLVESSNEAAEVIAGVIGRENFINKMNEKAKSLGLENTTFTDPSGLDNGNVSTTADLMRLLQYIHNNRSFVLQLTKDADLDTAYVSGEFGDLVNFNSIDGVANFIGGKVGETLAAGQTSASVHTLEVRGEERVIIIVLLNSSDREADIISLHKYVAERYGDL